MFCRLTKAAIWLLAAGIFAASASAAPITFDWQGNNGFTGFFTLDSSAFAGTANDEIFQSNLTAFSFAGPGFAFNLTDVLARSAIVFDSSMNPPAYSDGAADAANDLAGNRLVFFPSEIQYAPVTGQEQRSTGKFVVAASDAPEPATWMLLSLALLGAFAAKSLRSSHGRSNSRSSLH